MPKKSETQLTGPAACPCKRSKCPRHRDCTACRAYHHFPDRETLTTCERLQKKATHKKRG